MDYSNTTPNIDSFLNSLNQYDGPIPQTNNILLSQDGLLALFFPLKTQIDDRQQFNSIPDFDKHISSKYTQPWCYLLNISFYYNNHPEQWYVDE